MMRLVAGSCPSQPNNTIPGRRAVYGQGCSLYPLPSSIRGFFHSCLIFYVIQLLNSLQARLPPSTPCVSIHMNNLSSVVARD